MRTIRILAGVAVSALLAISPVASQADDAATPAASAPANKFQEWFNGLTDKVEFGGSFTARFDHGAQMAGSISTLGIVGGRHSLDLTKTYSVEWGIGPALSFVPSWTETDIGIGGSIDLLHLPKQLAAMQDTVPMVRTLTPKLTVLKGFLAVQANTDKLFTSPEIRVTGGFTLPFGATTQ